MAAHGVHSLLHWGGDAFPSIVKAMYASTVRSKLEEDDLSFIVRFSDEEILFSLTHISSTIRVPTKDPGPKSVKDTLTKDKGRTVTETICGRVVPWKERYFLQATTLLPPFESCTTYLHSMCIHETGTILI